jgi:long-chain acyl-CoA synthetase
MTEYWNNPLETAETLRHHGEGGPWVHTGDLARVDEDGYVFLVDRKKDMLKTSGFQVWPREIEEVISAHPAVREVGVAGIPDSIKGEVAKAWVVLKAGQQVTAEEIRTYCRDKLAPYKVPAQVEFRADLPKTMVGKVLRRALAAEAKPN